MDDAEAQALTDTLAAVGDSTAFSTLPDVLDSWTLREARDLGMCGIPVVLDFDLPPNVVELRGETTTRIVVQ